jgi:hypothetical protein
MPFPGRPLILRIMISTWNPGCINPGKLLYLFKILSKYEIEFNLEEFHKLLRRQFGGNQPRRDRIHPGSKPCP